MTVKKRLILFNVLVVLYISYVCEITRSAVTPLLADTITCAEKHSHYEQQLFFLVVPH